MPICDRFGCLFAASIYSQNDAFWYSFFRDKMKDHMANHHALIVGIGGFGIYAQGTKFRVTKTSHIYVKFGKDTKDKQAKGKLAQMLKKEMVVAPAVDWARLEEIGIYEELRPYLVRTYEDLVFGLVEDSSWENAFRIQENVYMELTLEFLASFKYKHPDNQNDIRFRLMGTWHDFSLAQFASLLDLYPEHLTTHPHFPDYLAGFETGPFSDQRNSDFFASIANVDNEPSDNKVSQILNQLHRMLHRFITFTVSHSYGTNKCPNLDLLPLWGAIDPRNKLNLPHVFAVFFRDRARGQYAISPICGGHLVIRIARKLGNMEKINIFSVKNETPRVLTESHFKNMIARIGRSNRYTFVPPTPRRPQAAPGVEQPQPQPAVPRHVRTCEHELVQPGPQPEVNIQSVLDRMNQIELSRQEEMRQYDMRHRQEANALGGYFNDTQRFLGHICDQAGYGYPPGYPFDN